MESSPTNMSFLPKAADRWSPAAPTKIKNSVGEGFPLPLVGIFILHPGGALPSLPCVRGGAALRAAEGLYPTKTIFFFCSANSPPLQSLRRCRASSLYTREPFGRPMVARAKAPFPTLTLCVNRGWRQQVAGGERATKELVLFRIPPTKLECDNHMNFPILQNFHSLAGSPTRSRGSPLPEGAFRATNGRPCKRKFCTDGFSFTASRFALCSCMGIHMLACKEALSKRRGKIAGAGA